MSRIFFNPYLLSVLSGILLRLSFPKPGMWFLAWFGFIPLFFAIRKQRPLKAFVFSFISGAVFFISTMFWLINVTVPGMIVLSLYLALYFAVFGMMCSVAREKIAHAFGVIFIPALWVFLEFVRSYFLTGMPWALLGMSQAPNLPAIQAADITGVYGVSFMLVFVNTVLFEFVFDRGVNKSASLKKLVFLAAVIPVWFGYGFYRLAQDPLKNCAFRVAIVQGNIPQDIKWASSFSHRIFEKYQLMTEIVDLKEEPDLIVWPETSYPGYYEPEGEGRELKDFSQQLETPLLAGSVSLRDMHYYNSAILLNGAERTSVIYDKMHLVPFGEYIPCRKLLPFIERILPIEDFTPGKTRAVFSLRGSRCPDIKLSAMICFEDIFPDIARGFVLRGADLLVNMTNDAWFDDTSSPYQHMQASVFRAVENRVYVLRAANTGISCYIDDTGRVYSTIKDAKGKPTFISGYAVEWVTKTGRRSLYTKIGDVFALLCIFYVIIIMMSVIIKRK